MKCLINFLFYSSVNRIKKMKFHCEIIKNISEIALTYEIEIFVNKKVSEGKSSIDVKLSTCQEATITYYVAMITFWG